MSENRILAAQYAGQAGQEVDYSEVCRTLQCASQSILAAAARQRGHAAAHRRRHPVPMRSAGLCGNFGISGLLQGLVARASLQRRWHRVGFCTTR